MTKYIIVTYYKIQNAVFLIPKYTYNISKYGKNNTIPIKSQIVCSKRSILLYVKSTSKVNK